MSADRPNCALVAGQVSSSKMLTWRLVPLQASLTRCPRTMPARPPWTTPAGALPSAQTATPPRLRPAKKPLVLGFWCLIPRRHADAGTPMAGQATLQSRQHLVARHASLASLRTHVRQFAHLRRVREGHRVCADQHIPWAAGLLAAAAAAGAAGDAPTAREDSLCSSCIAATDCAPTAMLIGCSDLGKHGMLMRERVLVQVVMADQHPKSCCAGVGHDGEPDEASDFGQGIQPSPGCHLDLS